MKPRASHSAARSRRPRTRSKRSAASRRWSGEVTKHSDALDLESGVFKKSSPRAIATSLKRSAERSKRRKAQPYQSAMSMLNFYINRGGRNLSAKQKALLNNTKGELKEAFHRGGE